MVTSFEKQYAELIRYGAIDRETALRELELLGHSDKAPAVVRHFCARTDVALEELERLLDDHGFPACGNRRSLRRNR